MNAARQPKATRGSRQKFHRTRVKRAIVSADRSFGLFDKIAGRILFGGLVDLLLNEMERNDCD